MKRERGLAQVAAALLAQEGPPRVQPGRAAKRQRRTTLPMAELSDDERKDADEFSCAEALVAKPRCGAASQGTSLASALTLFW